MALVRGTSRECWTAIGIDFSQYLAILLRIIIHYKRTFNVNIKHQLKESKEVN